MLSTSIFKKRNSRYIAIFALIIAIFALATLIDGSYENYQGPTDSNLKVVKDYQFPLREISGMYLFPPNADGGRPFYVIGDHFAQLGTGILTTNGIEKIKVHDLYDLLVDTYSPCLGGMTEGCRKLTEQVTSQWEGIASDVSQKAFMLNEYLSTIVIWDPSINKISHNISLEKFYLGPKKRRKRNLDHKNDLAEGLILLKNGHIIIAKEAHSPSIIEFAPQLANAEGYSPDLRLPPQEQFPLYAHKQLYTPKKSWKLPKSHKNCDISEISTDAEGEIYVLSQKCQWIAQVDELDIESKQLKLKKVWSFPKNIKHAEALAVLDHNTFFIGTDKKSVVGPNMFLMQNVLPTNKNIFSRSDSK